MVHVLLDTHIIKKSLVFVVEFLMYLQLARKRDYNGTSRSCSIFVLIGLEEMFIVWLSLRRTES